MQRLIEDEELRDSIQDAFEAARDAYGRMSNGKGPARPLMDDKKVQKDLRTAAESLREASDQLRGKREQRRWRQADRDRAGRRGARDRAQRGRPQGPARPPVRRRGGVRVHLADHADAGAHAPR